MMEDPALRALSNRLARWAADPSPRNLQRLVGALVAQVVAGEAAIRAILDSLPEDQRKRAEGQIQLLEKRLKHGADSGH